MLRAAGDQWYMSMDSILMRDRFRSFETSKRLWKEGADMRGDIRPNVAIGPIRNKDWIASDMYSNCPQVRHE
jgi:hypothetical protein